MNVTFHLWPTCGGKRSFSFQAVPFYLCVCAHVSLSDSLFMWFQILNVSTQSHPVSILYQTLNYQIQQTKPNQPQNQSSNRSVGYFLSQPQQCQANIKPPTNISDWILSPCELFSRRDQLKINQQCSETVWQSWLSQFQPLWDSQSLRDTFSFKSTISRTMTRQSEEWQPKTSININYHRAVGQVRQCHCRQ